MVAHTLIVLCHGEAQARNIASWNPSWLQGASVVVVLDQVAPFPTPFPTAQIGPADVQGFRAGANRDKGLAWAMAHCPAHSYLFLDGDCIPGPDWLRTCLPLASEEPLIVCGTRSEGGGGDPRTMPLEWQGNSYQPSFSMDPHAWLSGNTVHDILGHRILWSCNFGMTYSAASMLLDAGEKVHGVRRVFNPGFDGLWGGEDTGLAILAHLSGVELRTNGAYPVEHIPHSLRNVTKRNLDKVRDYFDLCVTKLGSKVSFH